MINNEYDKYITIDPYPDIDAALLNSADISAYVKKTNMISPFHPKCLKGASYDVFIGGEVIYWDQDGKKQHVNLKEKGDYFNLSPNSIAFVTLEPEFHIPYYLALRFNLKITHIYKGLLLGTGPLVDPGFEGKLSIPLHNLTSNTYRFFKGDELITMEFTKMSRNTLWYNKGFIAGHNERYIPNKIKGGRAVGEYIAKALEKDRLGEVISSIPAAIQESKEKIEKIREESEKELEMNRIAVSETKKWSNAASLAGIASVIAIVFTALNFSKGIADDAHSRYEKLELDYNAMKENYSRQIDSLNDELAEIRMQLDSYISSMEENKQSQTD